MKIAINTRFLIPGKLDGIGWFTHEVVSRIVRQHPEHTFYFFFDRPWDQEFIYAENIRPVVLKPSARHPVLWHIWFQFSLKKYLRAHPVDLLLSPDGFIPLGIETPRVAVIHDLNFMHYPKELPKSVSYYYRHFFPLFARESSHIITVSEFSRHDIINLFNISPDQISVTYNGVNKIFSPLPDKSKEETRNRFTGGIPYFVHIGSLLPRKNIPRLLKAFDLFRATSTKAFKLVIAGRPMFGTRDINKVMRTMKYARDVILLGGLSGEDTHRILASAEALVFVSYFEGFGIPLIEAMASEVPVIAANATAVPEVCNNAALYVDPFSEKTISHAMDKIITDPGLRKQLTVKGTKRVANFSWDRTADKVWKIIQQVAKK